LPQTSQIAILASIAWVSVLSRGRALALPRRTAPAPRRSIGAGGIERSTKSQFCASNSLPDRKADSMTDTPPDHLSNDPKSPHYDAACLARGIGIRLNGVEKKTVEEYCVSEGWVRVAVGKTVDRHGVPLTIKLRGVVEPYFRCEAPGE
jgi:hypothetical protein